MRVNRIEWTFHTSSAEGSGTDSQVTVEILRDGRSIVVVNQEPGETARLDRGETGAYWWTFEDPNPSDIGTSVSGYIEPYAEDFPNGVQGHLRVNLQIRGDDAWRIGTIESVVYSGETRGVAGTIDSMEWVETPHQFIFSGEDVLSTNSGEGVTRLELNY